MELVGNWCGSLLEQELLMVLKICPVFVSVSGSTSAQSNYKDFAEINQHYNVEQSLRLLQNDA